MAEALGSSTAPPGDAPLVLSVFPSFAVGGAQVRFAALANHFGRRWRHIIISLDGQTDCAKRLSSDVPFALMPSPVPRGASFTESMRAIRKLLRQTRPQVLLTSNWGSIEWALANLMPPRIHHLHTEDGFGSDEAAGQKPRRVLARRIALRWSTVAFPSTGLLQSAQDLWRLPSSRLRYIPNGLDLRRFHPVGPTAVLSVPGDGPLIGVVAALRPEKNLGRLLGACALLRKAGVALRLVIIGDGAERAALEAQASQLGIADSVLFAGHVPDPAAAYRAMDLFALSSDTEQMPFSVMEAMATGLAVVSTDVGDVRRMLAPENMPYLAELDEASLAAMLRPLLEQATLRAQLGTANRLKAERDYDENAMFKAYADLISHT